jgi:hypothetical protein
MYDAQHIYAFDIETDNSAGHGLNPLRSRITEVALSTADADVVFDGTEIEILTGLESTLGNLPPGLLLSWNGAMFDTPWLHSRARAVGLDAEAFGLELIAQPGLTPKYAPTPGHTGGYAALWHRTSGSEPLRLSRPHTHLDISYAYKGFAESFGVHPDGHPQAGKPVVPWSLKPVAKAAGLDMVEIDRTALHLYDKAQVRAYAASDASGTRALGLRLLGLTQP